ncbi:MAG: hypothetical protein AABY84_12785 [Candidatus Firestonebacteria bacterium]
MITIFLFGCAPQKDIIKQDVVADLSAIKEPVYITARGVGSPSFDLQKIQERRMSANRSSISAAVYQLISFLKGLRLENGQIVGSAMDADTKFKEVVENAVKELYEVVTQDFTTTETCSSTIRLDKNKLEDKLKVKFNE